MVIYFILALSLSLAYILLMASYCWIWSQIPYTSLKSSYHPKTSICIVIPARNEAQNILACLRSLQALNYPHSLFEIIIVDDFSADNSAQIVRDFPLPNLRLLSLSEHMNHKERITSYKKKAIELAIQQTDATLIVGTDADCQVPPDWLLHFAQCYEQEQAKFIAAPVQLKGGNSLLEQFQSLDFSGMMIITASGIYGRYMRMCNGASLAYEKKTFEEIGGFSGIDQQASGDDMLLLQKIAKQYPRAIRFIKNNEMVVRSSPLPRLADFIQQRKRWASKSGSYQDWRTTVQLSIVWGFCLSILISTLLMFTGNWLIGMLLIVQLLSKAVVDYWLLSQACRFFKRPRLLRIFIPALFMHIWYIIWVGFLGMLPIQYHWKGRKVK